MGESPKSLIQWPLGRKALMRGVSTEYTGESANYKDKELFGLGMKMPM